MKKIFAFSLFAQAFLFTAMVSLILFSCARSEFSEYEKTDTGLMYKFHTKGKDTLHPKYGEIVTIKMAKRLGDSTLESTSLIKPDGMDQLLKSPLFKGAIEEGIVMMTLGDSATFLVNTDSINKYFPATDPSKNFKKNSFLAFDIKLMNIQTEEEVMWAREQSRKAFVQDRKAKEPEELNRYIQDNHIDVKPTAKGLYFIETQKGSGLLPKDGDSVVIHYTGSFLNGTVFGSSVKINQPIGFIVGDKGDHGVIDGWYEGIKMMRKGGSATWIIPSPLAFDSAGMYNGKSGKYTIPPYSPLKFDIQLLDVKPKK